MSLEEILMSIQEKLLSGVERTYQKKERDRK